jgi:hypothetical protein
MDEPCCPVCEEAFTVDSRFGFLEDGRFVPTCRECYVALVNLVLLQKLGRYKQGDPRKLLKQALVV